MIAAKDGSEAAVFAVGDALTGCHGTASANSRPRLVLAGLDPAAQYTDEDENTYSGVQLLTTGLELRRLGSDARKDLVSEESVSLC